MFEFEAGSSPLRHEFSDGVKSALLDPDARISAISLFSWEEHCTECALPACYSTCELFEARPDGRCRRFIDGLRPIRDDDLIQGHFVRVRFKRWATLFAYANRHLVPLKRVQRIERATYFLARFAAILPDGWISIAGRRGPFKRLVRRIKHRIASRNAIADNNRGLKPSYLLLEIVNPGADTVPLSLTIRRRDAVDTASIPFQELLECDPGANRFKVDYARIAERIGDSAESKISLTPNILSAEDEGLTLIFGTLAFVHDEVWESAIVGIDDDESKANAPGHSRQPNVKLAVWDLDNTVWSGTLVEDGASGLSLKDGIAEILDELDKRGILLSVASKNDPEPVLAQLERFGIAEYFLFPKISWGPKTDAIATLIRDFNIGANTVAFIDDSPFEREHVSQVHPDVRVYDAAGYRELLAKPEFNPPRTSESSRRRYFYSRQRERDAKLESFGGDYLDFLRSCEIEIDIRPGTRERVERMFELVTRTNQLNFSGNRYSREQISEFVDDDQHDTYCVDCRDRFGEYGLIGFGLVEKSTNRLIDMALSCRVQSKRVEHAFLEFLAKRRADEHDGIFEAGYRRSDRNRAPAGVFDDLGFVVVETREPDEFVYRVAADSLPKQDIVQITWHGNGVVEPPKAQIGSV